MKKKSAVKKKRIEGTDRYVFYVNVGNLPGKKAEEYVKECMKKVSKTFDGAQVVAIAVKDQATALVKL
jgi:hypothetical protein